MRGSGANGGQGGEAVEDVQFQITTCLRCCSICTTAMQLLNWYAPPDMHPTLKTIQLHEAIGWLSLLKGLNTLSGSGQLQITNQQELPPPNAPCCCMARL